MYPSACYSRDTKTIAVIGGKEASKKVECYDLQSDQWRSLPDLNVGRHDGSSCFHAGFLYVFGGICGEIYLNSIERIDERCLQGQAVEW